MTNRETTLQDLQRKYDELISSYNYLIDKPLDYQVWTLAQQAINLTRKAIEFRKTAATGPGCERHKGDPHNLCEACWALEPDPATLSVTQGGIGRSTVEFFPPKETEHG